MATSIKSRVNKLGYHLSQNVKDNMGYKHKYRTTPIFGSGVTNYFNNATDLKKWVARVEKDRGLFNPGNTGDWIPAHAVRILPSGDIQLLTEKGTMSNPGKRKSFLKKVSKTFGKVVGIGKKGIKAGKRILGNPKDRSKRSRLISLINIYNKASAPSVPRTDAQHKQMSKRARAAMQEIRKRFVEGVDYKEFSNGMLWPI